MGSVLRGVVVGMAGWAGLARLAAACSIAAMVLALAAGLAGDAVAAERNLAVVATRAQPAGEPRVALVIGNGDYPNAPLANPVNDARAVAERLVALGFRVSRLENAGQEAMYEAVRAFGDSLRAGGVGLFYYAGHALQVRGRNYLLPVAARIEREDEIAYRTVDMGLVLDKMDSARNRVNIVILDACRNNPFGREFRSLAPGLAVMDAPHNTLIAFATAPGAVASDGTGQHGLYTQHLLQAMDRPGLGLEDVFKQVRTGVRQDSAGRQVPWENTSLEVEFFFSPPAPPPAPLPASPVAAVPVPPVVAAPPRPDALTVELAFWDSIKTSRDPEDFRAYLQRYPEGQFAPLARNRLRALAVPPAPPTPPAAALGPGPTTPTPTPAPAPTSAPPPVPSPAPAPTAAPALAPVAPPVAIAAVTPPTAPASLRPPSVPTTPAAAEPAAGPARLLSDQAGDVRVIAVARRGERVATGGGDGSLRLWDLGTGRQLRQWPAHGAAVTALAWSPDGRQLLSAGADGGLRWWSVDGGAELVRLSGHRGRVVVAVVAPTGRYALTAGDDGELLLWALPAGQLLQRVQADAGALTALALSADGRWVLTGSAGGQVRWWDVGGLVPQRSLPAMGAAVLALAFGADGRTAAAVAADGRRQAWGLPGGEPLPLTVPAGPSDPAPLQAAAAGDALLLAGADGRWRLWPLATGRPPWEGAAPVALAAGAAGQAGEAGEAGEAGRRPPVAALALGPPSASGGMVALLADGRQRLWWWRVPP